MLWNPGLLSPLRLVKWPRFHLARNRAKKLVNSKIRLNSYCFVYILFFDEARFSIFIEKYVCFMYECDASGKKDMDSGKKRLALGRLTRTAAAKFNGRCSFRRTQFLPPTAWRERRWPECLERAGRPRMPGD